MFVVVLHLITHFINFCLRLTPVTCIVFHLAYIRGQCSKLLYVLPDEPLTLRFSNVHIPRTINIRERLTRMTLTRMLKLSLNVITTNQINILISSLFLSAFTCGRFFINFLPISFYNIELWYNSANQFETEQALKTF